MNVNAFSKLTALFAKDLGIEFVNPDLFDADLRTTSTELQELGETTTIGDTLRITGIVINTGDEYGAGDLQ